EGVRSAGAARRGAWSWLSSRRAPRSRMGAGRLRRTAHRRRPPRTTARQVPGGRSRGAADRHRSRRGIPLSRGGRVGIVTELLHADYGTETRASDDTGSTRRERMKRAMGLLGALLLAGGLGAGHAGAQQLMNGAGATFPYPIYSKWFDEYTRVDPSVRFNYQSIGSGGGIRQISEQTFDFGA